MRTLLVEGWRFLPHSYSIVNQFQCMAMLKRGDMKVIHKDLPYAVASWKSNASVFPKEMQKAISALPSYQKKNVPDAILRMGYPYVIESGPAKTSVFATSEYSAPNPGSLVVPDGSCVPEAIERDNVQLITPSAFSMRSFVNNGIPETRIHVVPHGVDPTIFHPLDPERRNEIRKKLGWSDRFVFLNISAMTGNKGIDLLLKAFAEVHSKNDHVLLALKGLDDLYGSTEHLGHYSTLIPPNELAQIRSSISYIGQSMKLEMVAELYGAADAYVAPYRAEGFNMPVLESLACGLPVICTAGGPTDEFLPSWASLRIASTQVPIKDVLQLEPDLDSLTSLMNHAIGDSNLKQSFAELGPRHTSENYTWDIVTDRLLKVVFENDSD